MQSVTIRTGDSNLSPEEIEKRKQKAGREGQGRQRRRIHQRAHEKATEKEEREKHQQGRLSKEATNKAQWVKVTTGIADDTYMEIKSGVQPATKSSPAATARSAAS